MRERNRKADRQTNGEEERKKGGLPDFVDDDDDTDERERVGGDEGGRSTSAVADERAKFKIGEKNKGSVAHLF